MKFDLKHIFLVFILFYSIGVVQVNGAPVCCYESGAEGQIVVGASGTCSMEGQIEVSSDITDCFDTDASEYVNTRKGCYINGVCYGTYGGFAIHDFQDVYDFFESKFNVKLSEVCNLGDYVEDKCSANQPDYAIDSGKNDDTTTGGGTNQDDYLDDFNADDNFYGDTPDDKFCADTGGPFNLFSNEYNCESLSNVVGEGEKVYPCIFNPYLSGNIAISSQNDVEGLNSFESACMDKSKIKNCYDYKNKENCEENVLYNIPSNEAYKVENLKSCKWVDSNSNYFGPDTKYGTFFNNGGGICISNATSNTKHFNLDNYYQRLNILKNPSFEDGHVLWDGDYELISGDNFTYDGKNYAKILAGNSISQRVNGVGDKSYNFYFYLKVLDFDTSDKVNFKITEYYEDNTKKTISFDTNVKLSDFSQKGVFTQINFQGNDHKISKGTKYVVVNLTTNTDIFVDAISFEYLDLINTVTKPDLFKPYELIPSAASSCELCFDKNNINTCTKEKSDLLGDCSYMVEDLSKKYVTDLADYLGKGSGNGDNGGNVYLNDSWRSQSIANSLLFCEMYLEESQCTSKDNFVNSVYGKYHYSSGDTLCKWDSNYGCYKDSDNTNGPDTYDGGKVFVNSVNDYFNVDLDGWTNSFFTNYSYENVDKKSDFEYACDAIAPQNYIYFTAYNSSLDEKYISGNFPLERLGNINIHFDVYDISPASCEPFEIESALFIDYIVNDETHYQIIPSSSYTADEPIKSFFEGPSGTTLFTQDGQNDLKVLVRDQSGNIGKTFEYTLDVDVNGPAVDLIDPVSKNGFAIGPLGKGTNLTFKIDDYSEIKSCNYSLSLTEGIPSNNGVDADYFEPKGDFDLESMRVKGKNDEYVFELPVFNSTPNPNWYDLHVECEDVFGQITNDGVGEDYLIIVDYDTSFILMSPLSFEGEEFDTGYLNGPTDFWAISVEKYLKDCEFDFLETDGSGSLNIEEVSNGFYTDYSDVVEMFSNVTGTIDFATEGEKEIQVKCSDSEGNEIVKDFTYFYDTSKPEVLDFIVESQSLTSKTAVLIDGKYYTRLLNTNSNYVNNLLNVSIDGSGSWISTNDEDYNLTFFNGTEYVQGPGTTSYDIFLGEDSTKGNLIVDGYDLILRPGGEGVPTGEENLFLQKYQLSFKDKAGNENLEDIEYYYDSSKPKFVFSGDLYQYGTDLYSKESSPNIEVTFNAPDYRKFACSLAIFSDGDKIINTPNFSDGNSLEFEIIDILPGIDLEKESLDLELSCVDAYGFVLKKTYSLHYDNTLPILNKIYLDDSGHNIYLYNHGSFTTFDDVMDKLAFDFEDTGEVGYRCEYVFEDLDDFSSCKVKTYYKNMSVSGDQLVYPSDSFNFLSDTSSSMCYRDRTALFNQTLHKLVESGDNKVSKVKISARCFDKVNLTTGWKSTEVKIHYVSGDGFIEFGIEYDLDEAYYTVTSLEQVNKVIIALDKLGEKEITVMKYDGVNSDGLHVYRGSSDVNGIVNGNDATTIWAIGYDSNDVIVDTIDSNFVVDKVIPEVELFIPDANSEDIVYFNEFQVLFDVVDGGGSGLSSVNLYLNDNLIYDANNVSDYDNFYLFEPDLSTNGFNYDKSSYYGSVVFNGSINEVYTFKIVARDGYGNEKSASKTVTVKDGVGIRLLDSNDGSSKLNFDKFSWVTKGSSPVVGFETSKAVTKCSIFPFVDEEWFKITKDSTLEYKDLSMSGLDGRVVDNKFYFDLSELSDFDLNLLDSKVNPIKVECIYNNTPYAYVRNLYLVDKLPDYVLESTQGFVLNTFPYDTVVRVKSVGPFKYISCDYSIDDGEFVDFSRKSGFEFDEEIDLDLSEGVHRLNILCEDILGTEGPTKSYEFEINKGLNTEIDNVELFLGANVYKALEDKIYINELSSLGLRFTTNKKDIDCSYQIKGGGVFLGAVNFIKNLFSDNPIEVSDDNGFLFELSSGLEFSDGTRLEITCFDKVVSYDIVYEASSDLDFGLS